MTHNRNIGRCGEEFAVHILEDSGYLVLERNFRTKMGEIDIVARKDGILHFVEVKTRTQIDYGYPSESITSVKHERMRRLAELYMLKRKIKETDIYVDVMEIYVNLIQNC